MMPRPVLAVVLAALSGALTLTAGSWAEAASTYRVYVPMVSRDAPATATSTPVPTPMAAPATPTQPPSPTPTQPPSGGGGLTLNDLDGRSYLLAYDGTYLGIVSSNRVASESICNSVGRYGSSVSPTSVRNSVGQYGSPVGSQSAYNPVTSTPPAIVYAGQIVAFLTRNTVIASRVDPDDLFAYYGCS